MKCLRGAAAPRGRARARSGATKKTNRAKVPGGGRGATKGTRRRLLNKQWMVLLCCIRGEAAAQKKPGVAAGRARRCVAHMCFRWPCRRAPLHAAQTRRLKSYPPAGGEGRSCGAPRRKSRAAGICGGRPWARTLLRLQDIAPGCPGKRGACVRAGVLGVCVYATLCDAAPTKCGGREKLCAAKANMLRSRRPPGRGAWAAGAAASRPPSPACRALKALCVGC
ncbi:MAG: hypothetical protein J3K34DRAFT_407890 [Monoraphidium minutum]|nr:MAG: hypothetical protein J3K34DRAFT_407890 [Monoraphidium minutum]